MLKSGIYKIFSILEPDKFYIGSSVDIKARKDYHFFQLRKGIHDAKYMQNYYIKHGKESLTMEIIEHCDIDKLLEREQFYLDKLLPCFNSRKIAESNYGLKHSEETRRKISASNMGKTHTEETKQLLREKNKKFKPTEEQRIKNSTSHKLHFKLNGSKKLTYEQVTEIRELFNEKIRLKDIASRFGVSLSTIKAIKYKLNWNH